LLAKGVAVRPSCMNRLLAAVFMVSLAGVAAAQTSLPPNQVSAFKDTSIFKPPVGAKVAILEFEDMECPACAHAFPIVHVALKQYNIPLVRHDFPLGPMHPWSKQAAVWARYMQDKISPDFATEYRREVFASQYMISSPDDLQNFTRKYLTSHGQQMPFVADPAGQFTREVDADHAIGDKVGLTQTPTIIVVTNRGWIQVQDINQLDTAIDTAIASTKNEPAGAHHTAAAAKH
jgi:protein-disulfide isomerase